MLVVIVTVSRISKTKIAATLFDVVYVVWKSIIRPYISYFDPVFLYLYLSSIDHGIEKFHGDRRIFYKSIET